MISQLVSSVYGWHSAMHWLLGAVALVTIARCVWVWSGGGARRPIDRILLFAFAMLMTLQGVLGLVVLIGYGALGAGFPWWRVLHGVLTVFAIIISWQFARWDHVGDRAQSRNQLLVIAGALVCTFVGIMLLPGGVMRMMPL